MSQTEISKCKHGLDKMQDYVCKRCVKDSLNRLHGAVEFAIVGKLQSPNEVKHE